MVTLSENWLSEGWMDFEYKKYILLAYLKYVNEQFREVKLYPPLGELIQHYEKLRALESGKSLMKSSFPKEFNGIEWEKLSLSYREKLQEDEWVKEMQSIVDYAIPQIKRHIEEGKTIYEIIEKGIAIEPVGITPIYQREGYALLTFDRSKEIFIYRYTVSVFHHSGDVLRGIALRFIEMVRHSLVNTLQKIKLDLAKRFTDLPNPSAWHIHSEKRVPFEESLVPISKRLLLKTINA
ncbi:MAG: hypothetical protein JJU34_15960 [Lunatimonas sp.]|uniref:hypothetical protein n=1 Tax=Lunatimonas sp. TaxID=2060141 RepID=UPI00263AD9DA|nr:hypothetical protein [Lunatimonas sp.]MCC5938776.1 hypothetical protein [Lunatimonas sp.]